MACRIPDILKMPDSRIPEPRFFTLEQFQALCNTYSPWEDDFAAAFLLRGGLALEITIDFENRCPWGSEPAPDAAAADAATT